MSFQNISIQKLAIIFIVAGVVIVFAIMGSSAKSLFSNSVTEKVNVKLKQGNECIVEPSDKVPRTIPNCEYAIGDSLSVTYKPQQPSIEKYELNNISKS
jgi:hypothetical protein